MNLASLDHMVKYFEEFNKPLDDCMWMNKSTYQWLRSQVSVVANTNNMHVSMAGISCWEDDSVPDNTIETGTYEHRDGAISKVVRHRFRLA